LRQTSSGIDKYRGRYCGTAIDLTDPGTRVFIEEFSSVVASLFSGSAAPANSSTLGQASAASDIAALTKKQPCVKRHAILTPDRRPNLTPLDRALFSH
jgi:hypothetical protein